MTRDRDYRFDERFKKKLTTAEKFLNGLYNSCPKDTDYLLYPGGLLTTSATSSRDFILSKENTMDTFLKQKQTRNKEKMLLSLAIEYIVNLSLKDLLEKGGFLIELAPQTLERGEKNQKGVDLIIKDNENIAYLAIDVKLRISNSTYERDGFGWNQKLLTPYIFLSLGNFTVNTHEHSSISLRDWFVDYIIPKINSNGKIPYMDSFRSYLICRIERSLNGYLIKIREIDQFNNDLGLPNLQEELIILEKKINIIHGLFVDLILNNEYK